MAIEQIERLPDVSFIDDDINLDGIQKQMLQDYHIMKVSIEVL